jgi:16S rRNA (cytidine1402-2'-O)-methyltransferase
MAGTLFVVATPIGNLEDISARALRVLREVALIAAEDTRHTGHLLQRFGLTTPTTSLHEHNERGKAESLIGRLQAGEHVALVSDAGTPTVSDPGQLLIRRAHEAGIRVEPIPGPSALVAALSASGLRSDAFLFLGFPPSSGAERDAWFDRVRTAVGLIPTLVFYEAPHRIAQTLNELRRHLGDVDVLVARELTKAHEDVRFGRLSQLEGAVFAKGEFTVAVNIGQSTTACVELAPLTAAKAREEFGQLTETEGLTRRQAIATLSRRYRLSSRAIFDLLEQAKGSVG